MGCLFPKPSHQRQENQVSEEKVSEVIQNDAKPFDPKDFMFERRKGEILGRMPGTIHGRQFMINNCEDCTIYLFDHIATIIIDDCTNCRFFIGPVHSSIYIRDCTDCQFVVACQQFRTRDCKKVDTFLACATQPVIESSTGMKFGCFQYYYPELEDQFHKADLSIYNNNWSSVHDFTPVPGETNYSLLPEEIKIEDRVPLPTTEPFCKLRISVSKDKSVIQKTLGSRRNPSESDEGCLIVFFNDGGQHYRAKKFLEQMKKFPNCRLVQCKELTMQPDDAKRVFGSDSYSQATKQGPVIGFEFTGNNCIKHCQQTVIEVLQGSTGLVFVSSNKNTSHQQIENFYNYADMQMGC